MKALFLTGTNARRQVLTLIEECHTFSCAVAWATDNDVSRAVEDHAAKAEWLVIGTHRFGTCPELLARFAKLGRARVVDPDGDLFHPKLYVFRMADGRMAVVVGSHNMTATAFSRNVEASVLIIGDPEDAVFREMAQFVESTWDDASDITAEFLEDYARQYDFKEDSKEELKRFHRTRPPRKGADGESIVRLSWRDFVRQVKADRQHGFAGRLDLLSTARALFEKHSSLTNMRVEDRHRIAGTEHIAVRKSARAVGEIDWGWFGAMGGFGVLGGLVTSNPKPLSRALDAIPLNGPVHRNHYQKFAKGFRDAFRDEKREGRIPSATRLLAIKRPDVFVCFNRGNSAEICDRLGVHVTGVSLDNYWDAVVEPIQTSRWWRAPEPKSHLDSRIWRGRAALLDAIYYEPVSQSV